MISFYSKNLIDQAIITTSSENALFPLINLKDARRSKVFRSQLNTAIIILDFNETSEIDTVMLTDNPRDGFGVSEFEIQFNATSNFSNPAFSVGLEFNQKHGLAIAEFPLQEYRFARIIITSSLDYCELSKIFIGKKIQFENEMGPDIGWSYADKELSKVSENRYGQRFVDVLGRQREISFSLTTLNKDELDQILEIYDDKGITKPFWVRIGNNDMINDMDRFGGMFFMNSIPRITNKAFGLYDLAMTIEEAM
jgi:hypothetical protein